MTDTVELFINQQTSANTRRAYRQDLLRWVAFLDGRHPTMEDALAFKKGLETALAPASAARTWAAVRSYYRWLGGDNPFDRVKAPARITGRTPEVPADTDVDRLLAAVDTSDTAGLRHKAIISLLLNGLRAQEVADLGRNALDYVPEYGAFVLRVVGKGMKERLVPALPETVAAVQAYHIDAGVQATRLLAQYNGEPLTMRQVEEAVYKWAKVAGVEGMHPHALRHHYATRLARAGVNVLHLQKLMGHARADTTQLYVTLDLSDLVAASRLDPRAQVEERPMLTVVSA